MKIKPKSWDHMFSEYKRFVELNGKHPSKKSKDENEKSIAWWAFEERKNLNFSVPNRRADLLKSIPGFTVADLSDPNIRWEYNFQRYKEFFSANKRFPSVNSAERVEHNLASWVKIQKRRLDPSDISNPRVSLLLEIGVKWVAPGYNKDDSDRGSVHRSASANNSSEPFRWAGSDRWTIDRGAMPGEAFAYLDGDSDTAVAAMVEVQSPGRPVCYEVCDQDGELILTADSPDVAAQEAQIHIDGLKLNCRPRG